MIIVDNIISFVLGILMNYFVKRLIGKNQEFFKIIEEFNKKLPSTAKKADSKIHLKLQMNHMDLSKLKTNIDESDIDLLSKELEVFAYGDIWLKKNRIVQYSKNIQRIINTTDSVKFTVGLLQEIIESDMFERNKPYLLGAKFYKIIKC